MFCGLHGYGISFQLGAGFGEWMKMEAMNGAREQFGFGEFGYWGLKEKKKRKEKRSKSCPKSICGSHKKVKFFELSKLETSAKHVTLGSCDIFSDK